MEHHTSDRDFVITNEKGEKVVSATACMLLLNYSTGRVADITEEVASYYELSGEHAFDEEIFVDSDFSVVTAPTYSYIVMHRDIDTLHHMNNLHYLSLAREALPAALVSYPFKNIEIIYKRQIKLGATIQFCHSFIGGKHLVEIMDDKGGVSHALIKFF